MDTDAIGTPGTAPASSTLGFKLWLAPGTRQSADSNTPGGVRRSVARGAFYPCPSVFIRGLIPPTESAHSEKSEIENESEPAHASGCEIHFRKFSKSFCIFRKSGRLIYIMWPASNSA